MENKTEHYIENGIHFYYGEPDVRSLVEHHSLTEQEVNEISKHVGRLKRNARRREQYAAKKILSFKKAIPLIRAQSR